MRNVLELSPDQTVLVLSDVHVGRQTVDATKMLDFIQENPTDVVVFNGDIWDFWLLEWNVSDTLPRVADMLLVVQRLLAIAKTGRKLVFVPGNHDEAVWLACHETSWFRLGVWEEWPMLHADLAEQLQHLLLHANVQVARGVQQGKMLIVHGHEGWSGDWLWRLGVLKDRWLGVVDHVRTPTLAKLRYALVWLTFYAKLGLLTRLNWRLNGVTTVVHGHVHFPFEKRCFGIVLLGLPAWASDEPDAAGGLLLHGNGWQRVKVLP